LPCFSASITFEDYFKDEVLTRVTTRSFEIIGEAVKNLSKDFKNKHNKIEWKKIAGMRNKIIHYYFGRGLRDYLKKNKVNDTEVFLLKNL